MNEDSKLPEIKDAAEGLEKHYKYWLIAYHGEDDDPKVVHLTAYIEPPDANDARTLMYELATNEVFGLSEEILNDVKIAEVSDEIAREIIEINQEDLVCEKHEHEYTEVSDDTK